jgi:hypothetical protein
MNVSYGSGGSDAFSGGANASGSNTDSESYSKTHINSTINAGSLSSSSDNLTLSGANVEIAGNIDIETGNLLIESVQDVATSSSKTEGYNISGSMGADGTPGFGSVGANRNNSNSDSQWVGNQTTLIGGLSSQNGGTGEVNISADKTTVRGAVVASATKNENGTLTDNNNLTLITDELIVEDIQDKNHSESEGFNVSTSGYSGTGSTTVGLTSNGHETEQATFATLGGGNITKKDGSAHNTDGINRDLNNSQEITKDQQTAGLDATVTVDHRLASEEGRQNIAENFEDTAELAVQAGEAAAEGVDFIADEIAVLGDDLPEELRGKLGETGERFVDELIREDYSDEQIDSIIGRENLQEGLAGIEESENRYEENDASRLQIVEEETPQVTGQPEENDGLVIEVTGGTPAEANALQVGVAGLGKVQQEIDQLREENPGAANGVEIAINVATGGPVKAAIGEVVNYGLEQVAGDQIQQVGEAVTNYAGGAVQGTTPDGFRNQVNDEQSGASGNQQAPLGWSAVDTQDGLRLGSTMLGIGGSGKGHGQNQTTAPGSNRADSRDNTNQAAQNIGGDQDSSYQPRTPDGKFASPNQGAFDKPGSNLERETIDMVNSIEGLRAEPQVRFNSSESKTYSVPDVVVVDERTNIPIGVVECKECTGRTSPQQKEVFPQIESGSAVPIGNNARKAGFETGLDLNSGENPGGLPLLVNPTKEELEKLRKE